MEQAKKFGYKEGRKTFVRIELPIEAAKAKIEAKEKFEDFDPEKDKEQIISLFKENFNMSDEQAETNYAGIINPPEGWYAQPVLREDNKIISRGLLYIPKDPKFATFRPLTPDPQKHFDAYFSKVITIAKEKGSEIFQLFLGGPTMDDQLNFFKTYNFDVKAEYFAYEKEI